MPTLNASLRVASLVEASGVIYIAKLANVSLAIIGLLFVLEPPNLLNSNCTSIAEDSSMSYVENLSKASVAIIDLLEVFIPSCAVRLLWLNSALSKDKYMKEICESLENTLSLSTSLSVCVESEERRIARTSAWYAKGFACGIYSIVNDQMIKEAGRWHRDLLHLTGDVTYAVLGLY
ncbi:uncharacterized protein EV420DRAFT_1750297 [Desarmillaria tabescens]|uniref:Uncharacterized protein n=1 Tax=Armillaria tabescens TaxID=1929756 RepID=A0AA39JX11_ARMTA|nr:uncharacterized protein EV420DRAFT_1750297 [Desarmillaria tabescens]KAK0450487.1 hypothetical protein EV420DRAFT_1750297 [Desarmillaria tabescens]